MLLECEHHGRLLANFITRLKRSKYQLEYIVPLPYMELTHRFHLHTHSPGANFKVQCMYGLQAKAAYQGAISLSLPAYRAAVTGNCTGVSKASETSFSVLPVHLDLAAPAQEVGFLLPNRSSSAARRQRGNVVFTVPKALTSLYSNSANVDFRYKWPYYVKLSFLG